MKEKRVITRRDFIRAGSIAAAGGLMGLPLLGTSPPGAAEKSRVVLIRNPDVLDDSGTPRPEVLEQMLDQAFMVLMETPDPAAGWTGLFKPADVVGIKSNAWGPLATPEHIEKTIRKRLGKAGIKEQDMAVEDRGVLRNPVFQRSTALINVRPMRTHYWSGLGTLIKNYIMFVNNPSQYHDNACETLGAIWRLPHVNGKTRLNILVMLTPLFHGIGPHHFSRQYLWNYSGLILSTDPVAADAIGARIIQAKRNTFFGEERPISPPLRHIAAADTRFGLGNSRWERIDLVKLGREKDILV